MLCFVPLFPNLPLLPTPATYTNYLQATTITIVKGITSSSPRFLTKKSILAAAALLLLSAAASFGSLRYSQPIGVPAVHHTLTIGNNADSPDITWPQAGASIGTVEDGILVSKPDQVPLPTASAAKLITVLTILKEKPLALGEQGPTLTMNQQDIALYNNYYAANGSLVAVQPGEQLTQYQMLQGILIRSSNNLADSLAIWAFGSMSDYQKAAQQLVGELGMTQTTVGPDASGFSPVTTSTAEDLTRLGIAAMKHEVVREIVRQTSSSFPTDGTKPNTNWMLGQDGVVGIKTGSLPQIGGVFVIASEYKPEGEKPITIVAAVQGAATTYDAILEARLLADSIKPLFARRAILQKGTVVATIAAPWGESSDIIAAKDITAFGWKYAKTETPRIHIDPHAPFQKGAVLGTISIGEQSSDLVALDAISQPSWQWRLATGR